MPYSSEFEPRVIGVKDMRRNRRFVDRYIKGKGLIVDSAEGHRWAYSDRPLPQEERSVEERPKLSTIHRILRRVLNPDNCNIPEIESRTDSSTSFRTIETPTNLPFSCFEEVGLNGEVLGRIWVNQAEQNIDPEL